MGVSAAGHETVETIDELVEWVDEHDRVIEVVPRWRMRRDNLRHRSVAIVVQSSDGRLLVHRRADTKDLFPGWWDLVAGGVLGVDEAPGDAAARELAEELGIAPRLTFVALGRHDDERSREICHLYRTVHDGPYTFADREITEARLVDADSLTALTESVRFLPGSVALVHAHLPELLDR